MAEVTIYHNPRCSNSRTALGLLQDRAGDVDLEVVEYLHQPLDRSGLEALLAILEDHSQTFLAMIHEAHQPREESEPGEIARHSFETVFRIAERNDDLFRIMVRERESEDARVRGYLRDNHRRWIVGQTPGLAKFDGYEQNVWVSRQQYAEEPWADVVALWAAYNRHLRHVISRTPPGHMVLAATAPDGHGPVTVGFLMQDYVGHIRHHLEQVRKVTA